MIVSAVQYEAAWKEALAPECQCPLKELLYLIKNGTAIQKNILPYDEIGVKALGKKILSVTLECPCSDFLKHLSQPIFFPLLHCKRKIQMEFNGPFLVAFWDKDEHLCLKANPYFWNRENISLRQIDIFMTSDPAAIFALYQQHALDWIGLPLSPTKADTNLSFLHHPSLKDYAFDCNGAVDFSYASF
jgi:oligopeptide transport system substrate-binding protein